MDLVRLVLAIFPVFRVSEAYVIDWKAQTWNEANSTCFEKYGYLSVIRNISDFSDLTETVNITGDVSFWIGGKERRKYFIWDKDQSKLVGEPVGCFQSNLNSATEFFENQPSLCMSYCQHRLEKPFAGLSGDQCVCFDNLYNTQQVRDRKCNTPCPGDDNYNCGGSNMTTVYRTNGSIKWRMHEPGPATKREDCVLITQDVNQQAIWYTDRCSHQNNYLCKLNDETICKHLGDLIPPCYYKSVDQVTWYEAIRKCSSMGGHLAGKDLTDQNRLLIKETSYWTALNRVRQRWIDGTIIDKLLPRSESLSFGRTGCLSFTRENEKWTIQARPCREQHPSICQEKIVSSNDFTSSAYQLKSSGAIFQDILIGVGGAFIVVLLLLLIVCFCVRKRKKNKIVPAQQDHFYFILEKESVYNTISLETHVQCTFKENQDKTYYDMLAFEGSIEHSIREKSISGQAPVDYYVYDRINDVTDDYDVLRFNPSTHNTFQMTDDYFKIKDISGRRENCNNYR